jgi:hypothetical protein
MLWKAVAAVRFASRLFFVSWGRVGFLLPRLQDLRRLVLGNPPAARRLMVIAERVLETLWAIPYEHAPLGIPGRLQVFRVRVFRL